MISLARHWRELPQRYRYEAAKCSCGKIFFPPRVRCNACGSTEFTKDILPMTGKLATFCIIRVAPTEFVDESPYAVGIVEMDNGVKVMAQVADCDPETLSIGDKMLIQFRKVQEDGPSGVIAYGYKFIPVV